MVYLHLLFFHFHHFYHFLYHYWMLLSYYNVSMVVFYKYIIYKYIPWFNSCKSIINWFFYFFLSIIIMMTMLRSMFIVVSIIIISIIIILSSIISSFIFSLFIFICFNWFNLRFFLNFFRLFLLSWFFINFGEYKVFLLHLDWLSRFRKRLFNNWLFKLGGSIFCELNWLIYKYYLLLLLRLLLLLYLKIILNKYLNADPWLILFLLLFINLGMELFG